MRPSTVGRLRNRYQLDKCVDELLKIVLRKQTRHSIDHLCCARYSIRLNISMGSSAEHNDAIRRVFLSSDYEIELATRQTKQLNRATIGIQSNVRMSCDCIDATIAVDVTFECICMFTYDAKCDSLSCQFVLCTLACVNGVQQRVECTGSCWSRPTPRTVLMNTRLCCRMENGDHAPLSYSVILSSLFTSGYWQFGWLFPSKNPFHTDRLSHCSVCTTHLFQLSST